VSRALPCFLLLVCSVARAQTAEPPAAAAPEPVVVPPKLTHFVDAEAPPALAERKHAEVVLAIDVDPIGKVGAVTIVEPAGDGFDEAALAAAKQFEFAPGTADGKPVPFRITYRYKFALRAPPPPPPPAAPTTTPVPAGEAVPFGGRVLKKGDRTPQPGVVVALDDGAPHTTTDDEGRFVFDAVPVGSHRVHLRGPTIGTVDVPEPVLLAAGKKTEATYYVVVSDRYTTIVRGKRVVQETVEQTLAAEEFRRIPGTQGDTLKAVQNLPGVARSPFGGGLLVVWGSAPQDTRTYVDGVYIPTLYHFGGLRSTVNGEMVQSLSFLPGGYNVDYGRGLGGVVEIGTRKPREDAVHGFIQLDLIDASGLVEGPLTKNITFAVAARRSWIDAILPFFTSNDFQLSPKYWDYQAALHWRASPRDQVDLFVFGSDDDVSLLLKRPDPTLSAQFDSHIYYHRALVRWVRRLAEGATLTITPSIGYDVPFQFHALVGNTPVAVDVATFEYNLRAVYDRPLARWLRLSAGLDFEGDRWPLSALASASGMPREGDNMGGGGGGGFTSNFVTDSYVLYQNQIAPFVMLPFSLLRDRLTLTPQLRLDLYTDSLYDGAYSHAVAQIEPRFAGRYQTSAKTAVKLSVGRYHQAPQPGDLSRLFGNPTLSPEAGTHYVLGFDYDPTRLLHVEVQAFWKQLDHLIVRGENAGDPQLVNDGVGRVYGGELLVRQELTRNFFGWVAYTLSRSERKDHADEPWRLFQFDQSHILTIVGSYKLPREYQVGVRFRYVTGNPYTPIVGAYFDSNTDRYAPIYGALYSSRLPSFNQLDVRLDKAWTFDRWRLALYLDVQNVYDASSPEGLSYNYNYRQRQPIAGLPFLPVVGLRGEI
jgi:TonB family protein